MSSISKVSNHKVVKPFVFILSIMLMILLVGCEKKEFFSTTEIKSFLVYSMSDSTEKKGLETVVEKTISEKVIIAYTIYMPLDDEGRIELDNPTVNVDIKEGANIIASSLETNKELHAFLSGSKEEDMHLISNFVYKGKDGLVIESNEDIKLNFKNEDGLYSVVLEAE